MQTTMFTNEGVVLRIPWQAPVMVNTQLQYENEASTNGVVCVHLKNNSQRF